MTRSLDISDEDLQLYLDGDLDESKTSFIDTIRENESIKNLSSQEQGVLFRLKKFRRANELLETSSNLEFQIPDRLMKQIDQKIDAENFVKKTQTKSDILEKFRQAFKSANLWSMAAGGALASFCVLGVLQIQPNLIIGVLDFEDVPAEFRLLELTDTRAKTIETPSKSLFNDFSFPKTGWVVGKNLAFNVQISNSVGADIHLSNNDVVFVNDEFKLATLVLKAGRVSITYKSKNEETVDLLREQTFEEGDVILLPDNGYFRFSEPAGEDQILIYFDDQKPLALNFFVKHGTDQQ